MEVFHYTVGESKRSSGFNEMALSRQILYAQITR